ncbi:MAG: hypothetical protein ACYDCC_03835 [Actinomycetota bacterium]
MIAVAWSAMGLLAATLAVLTNALIGSIHEVRASIDAMGARLDARLDATNTRIDEQSSRIDLLTQALHGHINRRAH